MNISILTTRIRELNEEEAQELKKAKPDMMTLYQISAERETIEEELQAYL